MSVCATSRCSVSGLRRPSFINPIITVSDVITLQLTTDVDRPNFFPADILLENLSAISASLIFSADFRRTKNSADNPAIGSTAEGSMKRSCTIDGVTTNARQTISRPVTVNAAVSCP